MFELASPTGKSFRSVSVRRARRDATRDHYTLGRFAPRTVPAAAAASPRLGSRVLDFGLAFGFWLLAFGFGFGYWLLAFGLAVGYGLGFEHLVSSLGLAFGF